jgi:predicted ABC-type ATPase
MSGKPWLWLLAGPNGAGKSTCVGTLYDLSPEIEEVVNPDNIARDLLPEAPERAALQAGRLARQRVSHLLKERRSFGVETTLSGQLHVQDVRRAKSEGWNVGLMYVGLDGPDLAIERVRERKLAGGHHVPADDIARRYERSLTNLAIIYQMVDSVLILDNSSTEPQKVLAVDEGKVIFKADPLPEWVSRSLGAIIGPHTEKE